MASAVDSNQPSAPLSQEAAQEAVSSSAPLSQSLPANCSECKCALTQRYICILCDSSLNEQSSNSYQICAKCFEAGHQPQHPFFYEREHDAAAFQRAGALCSALLNAGGVPLSLPQSIQLFTKYSSLVYIDALCYTIILYYLMCSSGFYCE